MKDSDDSTTINLEEIRKLRESNSKKGVFNSYPLLDDSHKVIPYKRCRRFKRKRKSKKFYYTFLFQKNKFFFGFIMFLILITLLSYVNGNNRNLLNRKIAQEKYTSGSFISIDPNISQSDFLSNSKIISSYIYQNIGIQTSNKVVTESIHRNGPNTLYANGHFYMDDSNPIYFDIILVGQKVTSLMINGFQYAK